MLNQGSPFRKIVGLFALTTLLAACGQNQSNNASVQSDSSASGAAAGAVGGALSSSASGGTQASFKYNQNRSFMASLQSSLRSNLNPLPKAMADVLCPTFRSTDATCNTSGSSMWLSYDDCTFRGDGTWNGVQSITMSSGAAACGTFPNPGANGTLYRQFVASSGANSPSSLALSYSSYSATIDDSSANLANFDGHAIAAIENGGYGSAVQFNAQGARSQVTVGHHISVTGAYNHSVTGSLTITETAGASSRTLNGSMKVYHNILRVVGTSTFTNVVHEDMCCLPVSGSITTVFAAGTNVSPTIEGAKAVGKSETLTFTGCGTGTLQGYDGSSTSVSLNHCF